MPFSDWPTFSSTKVRLYTYPFYFKCDPANWATRASPHNGQWRDMLCGREPRPRRRQHHHHLALQVVQRGKSLSLSFLQRNRKDIRVTRAELPGLCVPPAHGVGGPGEQAEAVQALRAAGEVDGGAHAERDAGQPPRGCVQVDRGASRGRVGEQFIAVLLLTSFFLVRYYYYI